MTRSAPAAPARARYDRDPVAGLLDHDLDDPLVLLVREGRRFPRGSAGDQTVSPVRDVELDELSQLGLVDPTIVERRDHGD